MKTSLHELTKYYYINQKEVGVRRTRDNTNKWEGEKKRTLKFEKYKISSIKKNM